jgi:hypothetical protein
MRGHENTARLPPPVPFSPSEEPSTMMKLISATPSPYARKVRIALAEKSLPFDLVTEVPWNEDTQTPRYNPLEKLPVLLSGNFFHAMGDKVDKSRGVELTAGGFVYLPGGMNHYVWMTSESIVQVTGTGPFGLIYANPADDPSKTQ